LKNRILLLGGLVFLLFGIAINICMFIFKWYPTYIFFIICLIGFIQISISRIKLKIKNQWQIFWISLPLFLGFIIYQVTSASKDVFLIPEKFKGRVTIQYNQKNGAEKEFEGFWWRIYKVPKNGILNTKFEIKGNCISYSSSKYFFVDKNGNRKEIKQFCQFCDDKDTLTVKMIIGTVSENKNGKYQDFYIDQPNKKYRYQ